MNNGMKESKTGIIAIEDFSPEVIENLIKFIYTSEIDENQISIEFFMAVDKYDLGNDIREFCIKHLISNLTVDNAAEILAKSYQINCMDLKRSAYKFIKRHKGEIVENEICHEVFLQALGSIFLKPKTVRKQMRQQESKHSSIKVSSATRMLRNTKEC